MASWQAATALTGVLVLACATAAGHPSSSFSISNLQWKGAATIALGAPLMDLRLSDNAEAHFRLSANHVRIETDSQNKFVAGAAVSTATEPPTTTSTELHDWASDWGARPSAGLFLQSDADAVLSAAATAGTVSVPVHDCLAEPSYFTTGRPANCPSLRQAMAVSTDSPSWSVTGNFSVALWGWEARETDIWSGARPTAAGTEGLGEQEFRSLHLFVEEGVLEFSSPQSRFEGYAGSTTISSASETAIAATGGDGLDLAGRRTVEIQRSLSGLQARNVMSADVPNRWTVPVVGGALGLVGLVAVPGAFAVRRRVAANHMLNASHNMMIGNYEAAVSHALDAAHHSRFRGAACTVASIGMLRAGDLENAESFIEGLSSTLERAAIAYLLANLRVLQGRPLEAKALLDECRGLDPAMGPEIDANPLFTALAGKGAGVGYQ